MVHEVVGMVNVVPSRSDLMQESGGSAGMVVLVGGCNTLVLCITSLVVGGRASWGALSVV